MRVIKNESFVPSGSLLTFLKEVDPFVDKKGRKFRMALYKCECGNEKLAKISVVLSGTLKSCSCLRKNKPNRITHGLRSHPLYIIWAGVKSRCYNSKTKHYNLYGGKGIKMCDEWKNDFKSFYDWAIANGWEKGLKLDKDKKLMEKGLTPNIYSPETCSFLTNIDNCSITSKCRHITFEGKTMTLSGWARYLGLKQSTLNNRINTKKWPLKKSTNL